MSSLDLSHNLITNLTEDPFKQLLLDGLVFADPGIEKNFRLNLYECPIHCCSVTWLFLEGIKYGEEYKEQLFNNLLYCDFGNDLRHQIWDLSCDDFEVCEDLDDWSESNKNFAQTCHETEPEQLPEPDIFPPGNSASSYFARSFSAVVIVVFNLLNLTLSHSKQLTLFTIRL